MLGMVTGLRTTIETDALYCDTTGFGRMRGRSCTSLMVDPLEAANHDVRQSR